MDLSGGCPFFSLDVGVEIEFALYSKRYAAEAVAMVILEPLNCCFVRVRVNF
jgi:hypothetical protein